MHVTLKIAEQMGVDSQTAAIATAALVVPGTGFKWRVTGWRASYSGLAITVGLRATITGLEGVTIGRGVTSSDAWEVNLTSPLDGADNGNVILTLPSGGAGAVGDVSIMGYRVSITLTDG